MEAEPTKKIATNFALNRLLYALFELEMMEELNEPLKPVLGALEAHYREQGKDWCKTLDILSKFTDEARSHLHYNNNNQSVDRYLTQIEIAELWDLSRQTVIKWTKKGLLTRINRKYKYSEVSRVMQQMGIALLQS